MTIDDAGTSPSTFPDPGVAAVAASTKSEKSRRPGSAPGWLVWTMIVLASVVAIGASMNAWLNRQVLDTDNWVEASDQALEEPAVRAALSTYLVNDSPGGGKETDWIITVARPEGIVYFVCTAPQAEFDTYRKACGAVLDSVRFR